MKYRAARSLRFGIPLALLLAFGGCGARSDLSDSPRNAAVSALDSGVYDASIAQDASITAGPFVDCPAALLPGAPTPMRGYCPTRAYRTPGTVPSGIPAFAWTTAFPVSTFFQAIEIVVDDRGTSFVTVQTNNQIAYLDPDTLFAIDANGVVLWTQSFQGAGPEGLFLAADGNLRFRLAESAQTLLVTMSREGEFLRKTPLPDHQGRDFAVGRDGSLYTEIFDSQTSMSIVKLTQDGVLVWKSVLVPYCSLSASAIALSNDDLVLFAIAGTNDNCQSAVGRLMAIDADGNTAWQHDFAAETWAIDPAVAPDGSIRIGVESDPNTHQVALHAIDIHGNTQWIASLRGNLNNVGDAPMPIGNDGSAYPRTRDGVEAVSAQGVPLWIYPSDSDEAYDAVIDSKGRLAIGHGDVTVLDGQTGIAAWTLPTSIAKGELSVPFAVGKGGAIEGTMSGPKPWSLYFAR